MNYTGSGGGYWLPDPGYPGHEAAAMEKTGSVQESWKEQENRRATHRVLQIFLSWRRWLLGGKRFSVETQVVFNKGTDKKIAVIVTFAHCDLRGIVHRFTGGDEPLGFQLLR